MNSVTLPTNHEDFEIIKWGGPNQGTGGVHWELRHVPSKKRINSYKRKRDALHVADALVAIAPDVRRLAELQNTPSTDERRALTCKVNDVYLAAERQIT